MFIPLGWELTLYVDRMFGEVRWVAIAGFGMAAIFLELPFIVSGFRAWRRS